MLDVVRGTLVAELLSHAVANPDRIVVDGGEGGVLTGRALTEGSNLVAGRLVRLGVKPGDRVLVQVDKSLNTILLYLGVLRAGAVYAPLNAAYTEAELSYFVSDAEPVLLVVEAKHRDRKHALFGDKLHAVSIDELTRKDDAGEGVAPVYVAREPGDAAAMLYTSGTTGRPKGVPLTNRNLLSNAEVLAQHWRVTSDDVLLHALPIFHAHGLFVALNVALLSGARVIFHAGFDPERIVRDFRQATVFMGVPTFYSRLLDQEGLSPEGTASMRLFIAGSAPLSPEQHRRWKERTGHVILERYGMTETIMSTSNPYEGDRVAGSIGLPLPGVSLRICDPATGAPVPQGEVGELEVTGPNVFGGYWRRERSAGDFRSDGYFRTGDLGRVDARGYVFLSGRAKELIITGGYNVYPKEIENAIEATGKVREVAVFGLPHSDFGEAVTAAVVPTSDGVDVEALTLELKQVLAGFKVPKRIVTIDELPRNALGKVVKSTLQETFSGLYGGAA